MWRSEAVEHPGPVKFDGAHADTETVRNLLMRIACHETIKHVALARGEVGNLPRRLDDPAVRSRRRFLSPPFQRGKQPARQFRLEKLESFADPLMRFRFGLKGRAHLVKLAVAHLDDEPETLLDHLSFRDVECDSKERYWSSILELGLALSGDPAFDPVGAEDAILRFVRAVARRVVGPRDGRLYPITVLRVNAVEPNLQSDLRAVG